MVKFIHTSDWQIGMKGSGLGTAGDLVRKIRIESIANIFKAAQTNKVDFVLIAGDIFEHNLVSLEDVSSVIKIFNQFSNIPIFLLPGNHDNIGPGSVYERDIFKRVEHLRILDSSSPLTIDGVTIHPNPVYSIYNPKYKETNFECVKEVPGIHIGIAHGSLLGEFHETGEIDLPIDRRCVDASGLDYLALGHWHSQKIFEDESGVPRIAYSGTHEQTKYDENLAGYCLLVEIDSKGSNPKITPIKCGLLSWVSLKTDIRDKLSVQQLDELLKNNKNIDLIRIELNGEIDIIDYYNIEKILEYNRTLHKDFRVKSDSLKYTTPFNLESQYNFDDPTLNLVDRELRFQLQKEFDPDKRSILVESISLLNKLSMEE